MASTIRLADSSDTSAVDERLLALVNLIREDPSLGSHKRLGCGAYGSVNETTIGGKKYALKKMSLEGVNSTAHRREMSISQSLKPFLTIVSSTNFVRTRSDVYILMDLVSGTSMDKPAVQDSFQMIGEKL